MAATKDNNRAFPYESVRKSILLQTKEEGGR